MAMNITPRKEDNFFFLPFKDGTKIILPHILPTCRCKIPPTQPRSRCKNLPPPTPHDLHTFN